MTLQNWFYFRSILKLTLTNPCLQLLFITVCLTCGKSMFIKSVMLTSDHILTCDRDRELQFYESSNFEPYLQISGLEAIPLNLDYW